MIKDYYHLGSPPVPNRVFCTLWKRPLTPSILHNHVDDFGYLSYTQYSGKVDFSTWGFPLCFGTEVLPQMIVIVLIQLKLAMGKMDRNKDGKISRSEYLQLKTKYSHDAWNVKPDPSKLLLDAALWY